MAFSQNHDQVGNRFRGDRLSVTLPLQKLILAAGAVVLSPYIPLLFMGEEYGEKAPFNYFVCYGDKLLIEAVRKGRKEEFAAFSWAGEALDPQDPDTFLDSKPNMEQRYGGEHAVLFACYKKLLALRREVAALRCADRANMVVTGFDEKRVLAVKRKSGQSSTLCAYNFDEVRQEVPVELDNGEWQKLFDSSAAEWGGGEEVALPRLVVTEGRSRIMLGGYDFVVYERKA